jgi:hypothetical protein
MPYREPAGVDEQQRPVPHWARWVACKLGQHRIELVYWWRWRAVEWWDGRRECRDCGFVAERHEWNFGEPPDPCREAHSWERDTGEPGREHEPGPDGPFDR